MIEYKIDNEIWRDIPGMEGIYQCSNYGRVKSFDMVVARRNCSIVKRGRIKAMQIRKSGYVKVDLNVNGVQKSYEVHRLVLLAFEGKPTDPDKIYVNHKNFMRSDNRLENLEWVTPFENYHHSRNAGRYNIKPVFEWLNTVKRKGIVLDLETGVFYINFKEACNAVGFCYNTYIHSKRDLLYKRFSYTNDSN